MSPIELNHPEIGRELKTVDLKIKTVVVLSREGRPAMFTAWVYKIEPDFVVFKCGVVQMIFLAFRCSDETLEDDSGQTIHVWEYLGEI